MSSGKIAIVLFFLCVKPLITLGESANHCGEVYSPSWDACTGKITFDNGSEYIGEFKEGKITGFGTYEYSETPTTPAAKYTGEFVNGARHGFGTYTYETGIIYEGEFKNNHFEGIGKINYPNGDSYEGEFFEGLFQGNGEAKFASGVRWTGQWHGGSPQGVGIATLNDGSKTNATLDFSNGKMSVLDENGHSVKTVEVFLTTPSQTQHSQFVTQLNNGLGKKVRDELIDILSTTPKDKISDLSASLSNTLFTCMLIGDTSCFAEQYDAYPDALFDHLQNAPKSTSAEREILDQNTDTAIAFFTYRALISLDEETLKTTTSWSEYVYPGSPTGPYAAMRAALDARAALLAGNRFAAEDNQRRAKFFLTQNSLRLLSNQIALVFTLENDLYFFNDSESIRRFLNHCSGKYFGSIKNNLLQTCANTSFVNPYVYARLLDLFIESGSLNEALEIEAIESLHYLYNTIEIVETSSVDQNRESLYSYLSVRETFGDTIIQTFRPREVLDSLKLDSQDGIGSYAYLQIVEALTNTDGSSSAQLEAAKIKLGVLINELDTTVSRLGSRGAKLLTPTLHLL